MPTIPYPSGIPAPPPSVRPSVRPVPQQYRDMGEERSEARRFAYNQMYELEMLESTFVDGSEIQRVPGGWLFEKTKGITFVPYYDKEEQQTNIQL